MDVCEDARAANERSARTSFPGDSVRLRISRSRRQGPALRLGSVNFLGEFRSYDVCVDARRGRPGIVSCAPSPKSGGQDNDDGIRIDDTDADLQSRFAASYPAPHVTGFFPFDSSLYPLPQSGNSSRTVHRRGRLPAGCPPVARPSKLLPSITLVKQQHDDGTTKQNIHSSRWSSTTNLSFRSPAINRLRICE